MFPPRVLPEQHLFSARNSKGNGKACRVFQPLLTRISVLLLLLGFPLRPCRLWVFLGTLSIFCLGVCVSFELASCVEMTHAMFINVSRYEWKRITVFGNANMAKTPHNSSTRNHNRN